MKINFLTPVHRSVLAVLAVALAAVASVAGPNGAANSASPTPIPPVTVTIPTTSVQVYGAFDPTRPCTGILIDARQLKDVKRAQSPVLLATNPNTGSTTEELYPNPNFLPTLDVLQEDGIIRFYHSVEQARRGFVGDNPYIVRAIDYSGPFFGNLVVSAEDSMKLKELEKKIHYTQTWKVGFLLPEGK